MDTSRRDQISRLYYEALERPAAERAGFIKEACKGDTSLQHELESLLRYATAAAGFLVTPAPAFVATAPEPIPERPNMIGRQVGPYKISALLGAGGMGEVYRARDSKLERDVAIKILPPHLTADPERRARFAREARVLATLHHPNIGAIYELEEGDGVTALVLELVEGPTLADRMKRGRLPLSEALLIARQLAEALAAAHEKGVVHRDLKPSNIVLEGGTGIGSSDLRVKVLDFGLAKSFIASDGSDLTVASHSFAGTGEGRILGSPAYMSPEQARGLAVDKRTDIWAFGCVLYEMLAGRRAFDGNTITDTLARVLEREPDWSALPADTPVAIRAVLHRCLRKDPNRRLHDILDAVIEFEDEQLAPTADHAGESWRRQRTLTLIAAGMVVAATVLLATVFRPALRESGELPLIISTLLPAAGVQFNFAEDFRFGPPAISPDGQHVVYSALGAGGRVSLFLRSLYSRDTRELDGTDDGLYPFWSPDSRFIAFFAGGKLKKFSTSDAIVTEVASGIVNGRGGTWSKDDVILFAPDYFTVIKKVSAVGGPVTNATTLDSSRAERSNRFPWFLPDGRHFLYTAQNPIGFYTRSTVRLGSLDSPESTVLFDADSNVVYANGFLLYVRENSGTLVARPFDPEALRITGEALTVADHVATITLTSCGVFSVSSNGRLVYQAGESGASLVWLDRQGNRTPLAGLDSRMNIGEIHFTGDGRYVAMNIQAPSGLGSNIWLYDVGRAVLTPVTRDGRTKGAAVLSPDASMAVYDAARGVSGPQDLYWQATDGSTPESLLWADNTNKRPVSWSSDGRFLLFRSYKPGELNNLHVLPNPLARAAGVEPYKFADSSSFGQFSPDGQWVAYEQFLERLDDTQVWIGSFKEPRRRQVSIRPGSAPRWRGDGRELFYVDNDTRRVMAVDVALHGKDPQIDTPHQLPLPKLRSTGGFTFDVSPDGRRFLAVLAGDDKGEQPLTLVYNWTARLTSTQRSAAGH